MHRLIIIAQSAQEHFSNILKEMPMIFSDKVRLVFIDDSYMDIRYPVDSKYSFHWQRRDEMIRIDTAPHHSQLSTYPRHIHMGKEDNIIEDTITNIDNNIEENVKCVLGFVCLRLGN